MTGLTPYAPGSGVRNVGVAFLMLTPIGDHWAVATFANAERVRNEYVLRVVGRVRRRPEGTVNPNLATGAVEVLVRELEILAG